MKKDFDFERRPMVDWLAPGQLAQTGIKAVVSDIFGAYADKRDVMAALDPEPKISEEHSGKEEIWIDYAADLGDGFESTYTVARLLAAERLSLSRGGKAYDLPRGQVLVLGGDQVYPTASFDEYYNRLLKPYEAALPRVPPGAGPEMYAIPGNHDWYDGLSSFTRIFCQKKWIGGWKTCQRRSYFALKLPHNWWLWGIDIQLEGYIDEPQLRYFFDVGRNHVQDGDRVILCTAEPSWVYGVTKGPDAYRSLRYFEDRYISHPKAHPARLAVTLTGDLHHYMRYASEDGEVQRITAGGGGAYLFATHDMPEKFELEEGFEQSARTVRYEKKGCFPDTATSRLLTFGILRLPIQSWRFGLFLAAFYAFFGWILQSASKSRQDLVGPSLMHYLHGKGLESWREVLPTVGSLLGNTPMSVFLCLLIVGGFTAFCSAKNGLVRLLAGAGHGAAHVLLNLGLIWLFAWLGVGTLGFLIGMLVLGGLLGSMLMALYLLLFSFVGGFHLGEAYSGQRIADYKNFLRIHLDATGKLTIYPIGIRKIGRWKPRRNPPEGEPWFEPDGPAPQPELIEDPIPVS
ncbi:MAG: metallophosphoesterase [Thermoanaerobaculia bacterium]